MFNTKLKVTVCKIDYRNSRTYTQQYTCQIHQTCKKRRNNRVKVYTPVCPTVPKTYNTRVTILKHTRDIIVWSLLHLSIHLHLHSTQV